MIYHPAIKSIPFKYMLNEATDPLLLLLLSYFSCIQLCDPIDGSPPDFSVPGILQARTLDWGAISFSNAWKWKVKVKSLSRVRLPATPWTAAYQAPPSVGFSRRECWSGVPLPSPTSCISHATNGGIHESPGGAGDKCVCVNVKVSLLLY